MINPFAEKYVSENNDAELAQKANAGNKQALEELILRHQAWIYNIAVRMVYDPEKAQDITQEILIKMMTHLRTFEGKSSFRTWLYRIVANHVIDMKRTPAEKYVTSFSAYGKMLDDLPDENFPEKTNFTTVDTELILEETKTCCLMGMLLCLSREARLCFILGALWGANDIVGSQIMGITKVNFRKKLSRARKKLSNFLNNKCGLMNENNPCSCRKKTKALIERGYIEPQKLLFNTKGLRKVNEVAQKKRKQLDDAWDAKCESLYRELPFLEPPEATKTLEKLLTNSGIREIYELNREEFILKKA